MRGSAQRSPFFIAATSRRKCGVLGFGQPNTTLSQSCGAPRWAFASRRSRACLIEATDIPSAFAKSSWSIRANNSSVTFLKSMMHLVDKLPFVKTYDHTVAEWKRDMNRLPLARRTQIINCLVEGNSIRSTERMTDTHRDTIMRLGVEVGTGCAKLMDRRMRELPCRRVQVDEIWSYVGKKQRQVTPQDDKFASWRPMDLRGS